MALPDINATYRTGSGYLSTTFSDPTDMPIINRKWVFGDGVIIEGNNLQTINHTYYLPGEYDVTLIAHDGLNQYSVTKDKFVIVDTYVPLPEFIIAQSFDVDSGTYWRFYFDQDFYMVFEDNQTIFRSKKKVAIPGKWMYVDFDRNREKMMMGSFSYYIKEIETVKFDNLYPVSFSESGTQILLDSTMKIDDLRIWSVSKNPLPYYVDNRGKAGYIDTL